MYQNLSLQLHLTKTESIYFPSVPHGSSYRGYFTTILNNDGGFLKKLEIELPYDPANKTHSWIYIWRKP